MVKVVYCVKKQGVFMKKSMDSKNIMSRICIRRDHVYRMKVKIKTQQQKEERRAALQLQNVQLIGGELEDDSSVPLINLLDDEDLFSQDQTNDVIKEINNNYETENNSNTENKIVPIGVKITEIKEENNDNDTANNNKTAFNGITIKDEPEDIYDNFTTNNTNIINNNIYVNLHTTNTKSETIEQERVITTTNEAEIPKLVEYYNGINKISIVIVQLINENINCSRVTDASNIVEKKRIYQARKKVLFDSIKDNVKTYLLPQINNQNFINKLLENTRKQAKNNLNITESIFKLYVKDLINYVTAPEEQSNITINNSNNNDKISYHTVTMSAKNQSVFQQMPFTPNYTSSTNTPQIQNYGNENYLFQTGGNSSWPAASNYTNYNNGNIFDQSTSTLPSFNQSLNPHTQVMQTWNTNNIPEQRTAYNNGGFNNMGISDGGYPRIGYNSWPSDHNQYRASNVNSERAVHRYEPYSIGQSSIQRGAYDYYAPAKSFDNTNVSHGTTYEHYSGGTYYTPPPTYGQSVNTSLRANTSVRGAKSAVGVDRRRRSNLSQLQLTNGQLNAAVQSRSSAKVDAPALYCGRYPQSKLHTTQKCYMCNKKAIFMCGMCQKSFFCSETCKMQSVMCKVACSRVFKIL